MDGAHPPIDSTAGRHDPLADPYLDRPVDWRYRQSSQYAAEGRLLVGRAGADSDVRRLTVYLTREQACRSDAELRRLQSVNSPLAAALRLGRAPLAVRSARLETLLLSGVPRPAAAQEVQLHPATVEDYRTFFFDLGKLSDVPSVCELVMRREATFGGDAALVKQRTAQKLAGYLFGPGAVLWSAASEPDVPLALELALDRFELSSVVLSLLEPAPPPAGPKQRRDWIQNVAQRLAIAGATRSRPPSSTMLLPTARR